MKYKLILYKPRTLTLQLDCRVFSKPCRVFALLTLSSHRTQQQLPVNRSELSCHCIEPFECFCLHCQQEQAGRSGQDRTGSTGCPRYASSPAQWKRNGETLVNLFDKQTQQRTKSPSCHICIRKRERGRQRGSGRERGVWRHTYWTHIKYPAWWYDQKCNVSLWLN